MYNSKNKCIIKLRVEYEYLYFIPGGDQISLTKNKCREFIEKLKLCDFDFFDKMFDYINSTVY